GLLVAIDLTLLEGGDWIPLFRRCTQTHVTIGRCAYTVVNQLNTTDFCIAEQTVIPVAKHQYVESTGFKIFFVVNGQGRIFCECRCGYSTRQSQCYCAQTP